MITFQTITQWIEKQIGLEERRENVALKEFHHDRSELKRTVTYEQIRSMTNEICEYLMKTLKLHQRMIVISANETIFTVPLMLGILQSNNAFFICDFHWPKHLLKMYLNQLQPSLLICLHDEKNINIDEQIFTSSQHSSTIIQLDQLIHFYSFATEHQYEQIAYAVASSGSTGIPKLIFVSHSCILPNLIQLETLFDVTSNDCLLRSTPLTFDPALIDIFLAIHAGASIAIFSQQIRQNPMKFSFIFDQSQCTIAQMTPSFFRQIETSWNLTFLKTLILGGEPFPHPSNSTITKLIRDGKRVINIYGLTEMSCWASYYILNEKDLERTDEIPLGHPLDETSWQFEPILDDPTKNNCFQLIIESHTRWTRLSDMTNERQFRFPTDDLIRYDCERDEIFYLGRRTLTRKRLGIMINLEYIEKIAHQSNSIEECACLMSADDENILILLCKFKDNDQIEQFNQFLRAHLSEHFLPNLIVPLQESLPLTNNGKIDRSRLFSLYLHTRENRTCDNLANVWQDLLHQTPQMDSNFISQGGNSLMALTCLERIKHYSSLIDQNYLFDLILHRTYQDILQYVNNPQHEQLSNRTLVSFSKPTVVPRTTLSDQTSIWSIHRCNQIFLHNDQHLMMAQLASPGSISASNVRLQFHWKSSMKKCIDGSPVIVILDEIQKYVIIGSHAGLIHAYQIDTGTLIWSFQANDRIEASGTLSRNGKYFLIGDYSGMLYILNVLDGTFYSSYQCQGLIKSVACIHPGLDIIYLGAHDQCIHAIQLQETSSNCIWKYGLKGSCVSSPQLSLDAHHLFVATLSGDILAFESIDGHLRWKISLDKPIFSTMSIWKDKYMFVGCVDQNLYCLDCQNGERKWNFTTEGPIFSSPCLFNDVLFFGCHDRYLYALSLTRDQQALLTWKCLFPSMIYASPFVHNNGQWIVVGSTDGCLRVLDSHTGAILSEIIIDGQGLFSSPVCYHNLLLVGSRDDHLYCYRL